MGEKLRQPEKIRSMTLNYNVVFQTFKRFEAFGNRTMTGGKGMTEGWYKTGANFP